MKKLFCFLFVAIIAVSCEGPMGPMGPHGEDASRHTVDIFIDQWDLDASGEYFYADFTVGALTNEIYRNGVVVASIETGSGNNVQKTPLPYIRYNIEYGQSAADYLWSETVDFTYEPGFMTFYSRPSDLITEINREILYPAPMKIRVVLVW